MVDRGPRCGRAARILETGEAQVAHVLTTICARVAMSAHCSSDLAPLRKPVQLGGALKRPARA